MAIYWSCSCRCNSTNRIGDFGWAWMAWKRIYSLVCASISNDSFLFLFITRDEKKIGCWGQCLLSLLDTVSIVSQTIPKATFPRKSISIKSTTQESKLSSFFNPAPPLHFKVVAFLAILLQRRPIGEPSGLRFSDRAVSWPLCDRCFERDFLAAGCFWGRKC
jgi:hypothetical protein